MVILGQEKQEKCASSAALQINRFVEQGLSLQNRNWNNTEAVWSEEEKEWEVQKE